ncbi:MAG: hypothetical protein KF767_07775 [Bdellovibrionaceae bacterium]|nr:hypothetical protein [Pseudobdellovibrionaceae bacterium]
MKRKFLAVYIGTDEAFDRKWSSLSAAEQTERQTKGMAAWGAWAQKHADKIVDQGGPLGKTKRVGDEGITDIKNPLTGYVIVEANSHEEAAKMFEGHPHYTVFGGDSIEIVACLNLDEMKA